MRSREYFTVLFYVTGSIIPIKSQEFEDLTNLVELDFQSINNNADLYLIEDKVRTQEGPKVTIKLYYESLCPDCRNFFSMELLTTVKKLGEYLNLHLYPYGNAQTIVHDNKTEFKCQHGPKECYGNKLHACAIEQLVNITEAVIFNACMMDSSQPDRGSNDEAADKCGKTLNINSESIKQCANGTKGTELLKYYGDESEKANFDYVPYILINGVENSGEHFMSDVCAAFATPPPPCTQ